MTELPAVSPPELPVDPPPERPVDPPAGRLLDAVADARATAVELAAAELGDVAGAAAVGEHQGASAEPGGALTHFFAAEQGGYRGWRWAVTLAAGGDDDPITVSEVVVVPGPDALVAPAWVPWEERIRPGDLGVGDLLPPPEHDDRLVPGYLADDDPDVDDTDVREVVLEVGLGRPAVLSRSGRDAAVDRWLDGPRGPAADMARAAPAACATCGFLLRLAGPLRAAFGVCANRYAPADGAVVALGFGCGAHSAVQLEPASPVAVAELVFDDGVDLEPVGG